MYVATHMPEAFKEVPSRQAQVALATCAHMRWWGQRLTRRFLTFIMTRQNGIKNTSQLTYIQTPPNNAKP